MAQFLGDIAFLLELALFAAGLVLIHAGGTRAAKSISAAGWVLVIGAAATAVCTTWFWFHYHASGDFDHAHAISHAARPLEGVESSIETIADLRIA